MSVSSSRAKLQDSKKIAPPPTDKNMGTLLTPLGKTTDDYS
jgi:hypothetical protein